ncbi:MAG TPA: glycine cleavage T C-terminal barrel domain-containing protein [Gaiellales bacterium]
MSDAPVRERAPLSYAIRRSPYFERTIAAGAIDFMVYNHTYMPIDFGRDPLAEYEAMTTGVTLWDVGAERQAQLRGPAALSFADYLSPRDLLDLAVGRCRFTPVCDPRGQVMADCIVLRPFEDTVWYSHSDADISLWAYGLALARGADVEVQEADVAPVQLQGPLARAVLEPLYAGDLGSLKRFDCAAVDVAGVPCVVSNTGWSKEAGYELYPLGSERCLELWDALVASGEPHGLLITGPNITRAVEQGITDTQYHVNSGMTALEAGLGSMLELDGAPFMGREALLAERARGSSRRTIGLVADGEPFPWLEEFWPVLAADASPVGVARWAVFSYALERNIAIALVDAAVGDDDELIVRAPDGDRAARVHAIPFV